MRISISNKARMFLTNEEEASNGFFTFGRERGGLFEDISLEIDLTVFCSLTAENLESLQAFLRENAEDRMCAALYRRDLEEKELEEEREARRAREREQERAKKNNTKPGFVYLVAADNGMHKIGKSKKVDNRVNEFGIKLPMRTWLVHSFASNNYDKAELSLHEKYADKRDHGEWFNLTQEDVEYICSITDGQL